MVSLADKRRRAHLEAYGTLLENKLPQREGHGSKHKASGDNGGKLII